MIRAAIAPWKLAAPVAREVAVAGGTTFTVAGGLDSAKVSTSAVAIVTPSSGASRASGALREAVHDAAGVRLGNTTLVFGGGGPSESGTADVQALAPNGRSTIVGRLPSPRSDLVAATVGGKAYILGGYDGSNIVGDVLATANGTTFAKVATLPVPVRYPAVAVVGNAVYLFGGVSNSQAGTDTATVQRLDTATGRVSVVAQLPTSLSHANALVLGKGVYVLGGYVNNTQLTDQILRFDPATHTSAAVGHLPAPISDGAGTTVGKDGYLVGGQGADRTPLASVVVVSLG